MKRHQLNLIVTAFTITALLLGISCSNSADSFSDNPPVVTEDSLEVSDVKNSDCQKLTRTEYSNIPAIVMTKEFEIIICELRNFEANCGLSYFDINSEYKEGKDYPDSLFIEVAPVVLSYGERDCYCHYTAYFTIRNVKTDSFFLRCWFYTGLVSFKDSNRMIIEK